VKVKCSRPRREGLRPVWVLPPDKEIGTTGGETALADAACRRGGATIQRGGAKPPLLALIVFADAPGGAEAIPHSPVVVVVHGENDGSSFWISGRPLVKTPPACSFRQSHYKEFIRATQFIRVNQLASRLSGHSAIMGAVPAA